MAAARWIRFGAFVGLMMLVLTLGACKKKEVPPPPAPPPPPPAPTQPTVTLRAVPSVIEQGQPSALSWNSTNATDLRLEPGLGSVAPQGSMTVTPERSTTYTVIGSGPGGRAESSARITVNVPPPPPPPPPPAPRGPSIEELFAQMVRPAHFDFDKYDIRPDARVALTQNAEFLRHYPQVRVRIEGHCDERGSTEYNLGLGENRAQAARQFLVSLGISPDRIETVSYGKERPFCTEHDETCWQLNRRSHFVMIR